ncbi:MFS transporter [Microbacterium sp. SORGH_AS_0888]|uniref:MFS transporter n=1 Tax=Microbacterium sp. SORGH_AS_0888 TaxID=3041791 RepID=UPI0027882A3C|nr:MFS transporter [Microbacterium sp. SORGH_AS_0888]MDQ1128217.1 hypothetical protein [Microbacterium sp. SORGH_AS_0888]
MSHSPRLRVLLAAQAAFMLGFSSVVPFIAVLAESRFALGPEVIGAIVGTRVAVQQGLFLVGGALCDRFGARLLLMLGCGVRAAGFGVLATSASPLPFVVGVVLIGIAGALFSPAVDAYAAAADADASRGNGARSPFGALQWAGEAGGILGAAIGTALMPGAALPVTLVASALFLAAMLVLARMLPRRAASPADGETSTRNAIPRPGAVLLLAAGAATLLPSYTQLFSLVPLGLSARALDGGLVGAVSIVLSSAVLALHWPLARLRARLGRPRAVAAGVAAALVAAVSGAVSAEAESTLAFAAATAVSTLGIAVSLLLAAPAAQSLIAAAGAPLRRATRLGAFATTGGLLALAASGLCGVVAGSAGLTAAWVLAAVVPLAGLACALAAIRPLSRLTPERTNP